MIEFREAVFNSLLNMLRVSLEAGLRGDDKNLESASESNVAKLSEAATLPDSNMLNLVPDFKGKEEVKKLSYESLSNLRFYQTMRYQRVNSNNFLAK